ncbi:hypothetical protein [Parasphingopyxis algicola]|nr:hypothetical protein [Parasphingopyxis algicola]
MNIDFRTFVPSLGAACLALVVSGALVAATASLPIGALPAMAVIV